MLLNLPSPAPGLTTTHVNFICPVYTGSSSKEHLSQHVSPSKSNEACMAKGHFPSSR